MVYIIRAGTKAEHRGTIKLLSKPPLISPYGSEQKQALPVVLGVHFPAELFVSQQLPGGQFMDRMGSNACFQITAAEWDPL